MSARAIASPLGALLGFAAAFVLVSTLLPERVQSVDALGPEPSRARAPEVDSAHLQAPPPTEPEERAPTPTPAVEQTEDGATTEAGDATVKQAPLGVVLTGVVRDTSGAGQAEAYVSTRTKAGERVLARTDGEGRYTLGALAPGTWQVSAGKRDLHDHEVQLTLVHDEPILRQDFVLRPKQIVWVRLVATDGAPGMSVLVEAGMRPLFMNLVPVATRDDPGPTFTEVRGSLNNTFGIGTYWQSGMFREKRGPEYIGTVTLHEDGPAWLSLVVAHQVLRKEQIDPSTEEVTFVIDPDDINAIQCRLHATVLDAATSAPIPAKAWLNDDPFPMGKSHEIEGDGALALDREWPGKRWLVVNAEGYAQYMKQVTLASGQTLELGDIQLHRPVELTGHVRNTSGEPLEAVLRWGRLDPGTERIEWRRQTRAQSAADGLFKIANLEPGVWVIQSPGLPSRPPGGQDDKMVSLAIQVDATRGAVADLEVVMLDATAVTFATADLAEPWPVVAVMDATGLAVVRRQVGRYDDETVLRVPPGSYSLVVERDGEEVVRQPLEVGPEPQRVELGMSGGAR
ncbi:MAG: carboxypeptidase regulatory-like domain-containing protein [bacterium]|nr:carboxypeptidase regulatory-like domain-containing protein [bacterium]